MQVGQGSYQPVQNQGQGVAKAPAFQRAVPAQGVRQSANANVVDSTIKTLSSKTTPSTGAPAQGLTGKQVTQGTAASNPSSVKAASSWVKAKPSDAFNTRMVTGDHRPSGATSKMQAAPRPVLQTAGKAPLLSDKDWFKSYAVNDSEVGKHVDVDSILKKLLAENPGKDVVIFTEKEGSYFRYKLGPGMQAPERGRVTSENFPALRAKYGDNQIYKQPPEDAPYFSTTRPAPQQAPMQRTQAPATEQKSLNSMSTEEKMNMAKSLSLGNMSRAEAQAMVKQKFQETGRPTSMFCTVEGQVSYACHDGNTTFVLGYKYTEIDEIIDPNYQLITKQGLKNVAEAMTGQQTSSTQQAAAPASPIRGADVDNIIANLKDKYKDFLIENGASSQQIKDKLVNGKLDYVVQIRKSLDGDKVNMQVHYLKNNGLASDGFQASLMNHDDKTLTFNVVAFFDGRLADFKRAPPPDKAPPQAKPAEAAAPKAPPSPEAQLKAWFASTCVELKSPVEAEMMLKAYLGGANPNKELALAYTLKDGVPYRVKIFPNGTIQHARIDIPGFAAKYKGSDANITKDKIIASHDQWVQNVGISPETPTEKVKSILQDLQKQNPGKDVVVVMPIPGVKTILYIKLRAGASKPDRPITLRQEFVYEFRNTYSDSQIYHPKR